MKLRHRIIRWLSFGDMIFINAYIDNDGIIRSRNAGTLFLSSLEVRAWDRKCALGLGASNLRAGLQICSSGTQGIAMADSVFDGTHPTKRPKIQKGLV